MVLSGSNSAILLAFISWIYSISRLSSNILHHIKGTIIPVLLEQGAKQIQTFLEADFPSKTSSDQAKVSFIVQ